MKVALYARFSSDNQDAELSIGGQLKALKDYAAKHDYEWLDRYIYIDEARSALSDNRPEFKRMIADARKKPKPFDAILVWKLSRFARNRKDSIVYKSLLKSLGIDVISINEPLDDSPAGQLLEGIIEVIDEFYSINLGQDTRRGLSENARRGFYNGGRAPLGYKRGKVMDGNVERTKLAPDPVYTPLIQRIFDMAAHGQSLKNIVQTLNQEGITTKSGTKWGISTISSMLSNEIYTGTIVWNNRSSGKAANDPSAEVIRVENAHPALIDRKTFDRVQNLLIGKRITRKSPRSDSSNYLLSAFLTCGLCNGSMAGYSTKGRNQKYYYYACCTFIRQGRDQCHAKLVPKDQFEQFVLNRVSEGLLDTQLFEKYVQKVNDQIKEKQSAVTDEVKSLNLKLETTKKKLDRLYEALESGEMEAKDVAPRIKHVRTELEQLETEQKKYREKLRDLEFELVDYETVKPYLHQAKQTLKIAPFDQQKHILRSFIREIRVFPDRIDIDSRIPLKEESLPSACERFEFTTSWLGEEDSNPH